MTEAVEVFVEQSEGVLILPHSGEVVDLNDEQAVGAALDELRRMQGHIQHGVRTLSLALEERAKVLGTRTIRLTGGRVAKVSSTTERTYDAQAIERELREAGMPEDRIRDIVVEEVTYKVKAVEAKKAASANEEYAAIIARNATDHEKPVSVSITKAS